MCFQFHVLYWMKTEKQKTGNPGNEASFYVYYNMFLFLSQLDWDRLYLLSCQSKH